MSVLTMASPVCTRLVSSGVRLVLLDAHPEEILPRIKVDACNDDAVGGEPVRFLAVGGVDHHHLSGGAQDDLPPVDHHDGDAVAA
jgi:hypothetical protein